jgi:hypothetical protein
MEILRKLFDLLAPFSARTTRWRARYRTYVGLAGYPGLRSCSEYVVLRERAVVTLVPAPERLAAVFAIGAEFDGAARSEYLRWALSAPACSSGAALAGDNVNYCSAGGLRSAGLQA